MEAQEFYNSPISPLVTSPFSIEWSEDNHISLITQRGVQVFELIPSPLSLINSTLEFSRTFVYPSDHLPAKPFETLTNLELFKMKKDDIYSLQMQEAVTPKIEDRTDILPRIVKISWSPIKLVNPSKCLLAIVTSSGSIELLYKFGNNWLSIWNLSSLWYNCVMKELGINPNNPTKSLQGKFLWPDLTRRFLCTAIAWSSLEVNNFDNDYSSDAYIAVAYRSSDFVIWRIPQISDLNNIKEPNIVYKTRLNVSVKISSLLWINLEEKKHVLLIAYADGSIHGLRVMETDDRNFREDGFFKYCDDPGRIIAPISSLKCMDKSERNNFTVLATARSCLIALSIDSVGQCTRTRCLRVPGFSITGLTVSSQDQVIVTTQNCRMYAVLITDTEELTYRPVKTDLKHTKVQYLGLASSRNSVIFLNVTSPDTLYDHLVPRDPSTLQIFRLLGDQWEPTKILNNPSNVKKSLYNYWDCLEYIRIKSAKSPEEQKIFSDIPKNLSQLSIHQLRIVMWLTLLSQVVEKKQLLQGVDKIVGEISEAQPLIFILNACQHLMRLAKKSSLNTEEKCCIHFLRMYMEIYLAGEDEDNLECNTITRNISEALSATSHVDTMEMESCNLCGEILSELPWLSEICPAGHKLQRCSVTLLQINSVQYRTCPVCGKMFHPMLDDEYIETRCIYCDVPAQYDTRILPINLENLESRWKNLSKRPTFYQQESRNQEIENPNGTVGTAATSEIKNKRRCLSPQTFAVIVNKDDDDSSITETWQEF